MTDQIAFDLLTMIDKLESPEDPDSSKLREKLLGPGLWLSHKNLNFKNILKDKFIGVSI